VTKRSNVSKGKIEKQENRKWDERNVKMGKKGKGNQKKEGSFPGVWLRHANSKRSRRGGAGGGKKKLTGTKKTKWGKEEMKTERESNLVQYKGGRGKKGGVKKTTRIKKKQPDGKTPERKQTEKKTKF